MRQTGPSSSARDFLALVNPALALSAGSEAAAGGLIGLIGPENPRLWLVALASALLFGAGAVFGHYFDRTADGARHPERPLPARRVRPETAWALGWALLASGLLLALACSAWSAAFGVGIAILVVLYASLARTHWAAGALVFGLARGANLLLGLSVSTYGLARTGPIALAAVLFAVGWALMRTSRSPDAPASAGFAALLHLAGAVSVVIYLSFAFYGNRLFAVPFLLACVAVTFPRFVTAVLDGRRGPFWKRSSTGSSGSPSWRRRWRRVSADCGPDY